MWQYGLPVVLSYSQFHALRLRLYTGTVLWVFSLVHLAVMVSRLSQVCDLFSRLVGPVCIGQSVVFSRQYYRTLNWY